MTYLWLALVVESASISIESGGHSPDIGNAELINARELLRREAPKEIESKTDHLPASGSKTDQLPASGSLLEVQSKGSSKHGPHGYVPPSEALREFSEWAEWSEQEEGEGGMGPSYPAYENLQDPWLPQPPNIKRVPIDSNVESGGWSFEDDRAHNLRHPEFAANIWHPLEKKEGVEHLTHFGVQGHWEFGHGRKSFRHALLPNAGRRNPIAPKFDQLWPPISSTPFHGSWSWNDRNGYKFPDWEKPEEISAMKNAALGPGRWEWNWRDQNEIWIPAPREEYEPFRKSIYQVPSEDNKFLSRIEDKHNAKMAAEKAARTIPHSWLETSSDSICESCAGGCVTQGNLFESRCEFKVEGMALQEFCTMKRGILCAESDPSVESPKQQYEPPTEYPPWYWDNTP